MPRRSPPVISQQLSCHSGLYYSPGWSASSGFLRGRPVLPCRAFRLFPSVPSLARIQSRRSRRARVTDRRREEIDAIPSNEQ